MIKITFMEPRTPEWIAWRAEADNAMRSMIAKGPPFVIDKELYKKQREVIFAAYYGKCAYCEGKFRLVETGDVEHFRPKSAVKELHEDTDGTVKGERFVYIGDVAAKQKHPGYYWLAYEPSNLLPSCSLCNRSGKGNLFPVEGFRAIAPGEEGKEVPLLFHPGIDADDPEQHFSLDEELGILGPKTRKAKTSIEVFRLNREELLDERKKVYVQVMNSVNRVVSEFRNPGSESAKTLNFLQEYRVGQAAYSLVGRKALADCQAPLRKLFDTLRPLVEL